jgi:hypothetical protein
MDEHEPLDDEEEPESEWEEFCEDDSEPISVEQLTRPHLQSMPEDAQIRVMDKYL